MVTDFAHLLKVLATRVAAPVSEGEFQADLRSLKAITEELLSPPASQDPTRPDQALKALPTLLASVAVCKRVDSLLTQSLIGDVMSDVLLMLPKYHQQAKYYEALKVCVDFEKHYFKMCGQEAAVSGFSYHPDFAEDQITWWKETLTVGDELDAVRIDIRTNKKCWSRAKVIAADSEDDTLTLAYEGEGSNFNRFFKRFSTEIAPLATYTQGNEWRKQLKHDDLIDAYDLEGQWHNSTVLEKRFLSNSNGSQTIEINVGFRVYESNGTKYDENGPYRGWSTRYDEWVSVQSPRIAKFTQMARKWPIPPVAVTEEAVMDDSNDLIELRNWAFAMGREGKSRNKFLIRNLNRFGVAGLFDFALNDISNEENPLTFECFCGLMDFLGRIFPFYHKQMAKRYIQGVVNAASNYLLAASEAQVRNFSKEKVDLLCGHFENLYKRILTIEQKNERMDAFSLSFAYKCFQSQYLERRIQGLKVIVELTKGCKYPQTRTIRSNVMTLWLREHAILEGIFGPQSHTQLIQRSGELIHLLLTENAFEQKLLQMIWSIAEKTDEDSKMTVYKVLSENASFFRAEHLEFLVDKISALPFDKLLKEEIELVHDLTKFPLKASSVLYKVSELLLQIVREDVHISQAVADQALDRFCEIMKGWDMRSSRLNILIRCTNSIRENKAAIQCLKIIKKTLPCFPISVTTNDILSRYDVEMSLIADHDLMIAFFDNFRHFKSEAGKRITPEMAEETISSLVICERTPYREQIEERLSFLQVLYSNSRLRLTQGYVTALWELCIEKGVCISERITFLSWLSEVTDSQSLDRVTLEEVGLVPFFHTKIATSLLELSLYPVKSFQVFRNYFLLCNVQLGRMRALPKSITIQTSISPYYNNAPDPPAAKEFEYLVLVLPRELEGMELLRQLILGARTQRTMEEAMEFLCELYDNLAQEMQGNLAEIRREFIDFCKAEISAMVNRAQAITLLKRFLEESEKRGTGGLKSHSAMLRGDLYTLTIINQVSYQTNSPHIPKKFDFKVYGNTSVWELRCMVGKAVKLYWDQVRLTRTLSRPEIKDNENGKTIAELRLKTHDSLIVTRKQLNIPKAELLTRDDEIVEKAKSIFLGWFYDFADRDGKMNSEGCANFTNSCTGEQCKADDKRMQEFVAQFDDDGDGYLTAANFLEFYKHALVNKKFPSVWSNLYAHHYRNDLKCYLDIGSEQVETAVLPSYLLTQDSSSYDLLFSALADPQVANEAWELLIRLPTNPQIQSQLAVLDGEEVAWDVLLDSTSVHKLLYSLEVLEALAEDPIDAKPEERQRRTEWKLHFVQKGGFRHLYSALKRLQGQQDSFHKHCLVYILSLISTYILAAFKALEPEVYEAVEFVRRGSEMQDLPEFAEIEPPKSVKFAESVETQTEAVYGPQPPPADPVVATGETGSTAAAQEVTKLQAFQDLVEALKLNHCAEKVIEEVKFEDVLEELIELISSTLDRPDYETEDRHIIEASLALLVSCVLHSHPLIHILYSFCERSPQPFLFKGISSTNVAISKSFSSTIQQICLHVKSEEKPPLAYFLGELLRGLPTSFIDSKVADYSQYFELTGTLAVEDLKSPSQDYGKLASSLMDRILAQPYMETRSPYVADKVLQGLLLITEKIFLYVPELKDLAAEREFPREVWQLCLFPEPVDFSAVQVDLVSAGTFSAQRPPKGKTRETRAPVYRLLATLAGNHRQNLMKVVDFGLEKAKSRLEKVNSWNYSPSSDVRSVYGYSGIVNLGNICYMNSMLQQFYMVPQFRYAILEAEDGKPPTNLAYLQGDPTVDRTKKGADVDENVLHQLQTLFGYLELSEKQAFNPSHFCFALKDFEGQPVNISLQQDAQEFLNMAFDRLENSLKGTRHQHLLQSVFGGKACNRFVCQGGCNVINERFEDFYNLSLDVKHSKTLYESLNRYINGELISDFYCESCDKKVDMIKKTCISDLPNVLIIHLQRIIYNFDIYGNEKINTRLEFPHVLNLEQYTRDSALKTQTGGSANALAAPEFEYELVGVVVHRGVAEGGHYTSLIRQRNPDGSVDPKRWFEFNDSLVRFYE